MMRIGLVVGALISAIGCSKGFAQADIDRIKTDIRVEFGKRPGVTVLDVTMLKESPTKATGFVKVRAEKQEAMLSCEATYYPEAEADKNIIWKCQ